MRCETCGKETPRELRFCIHCGATTISSSAQRPTGGPRRRRLLVTAAAVLLVLVVSFSVFSISFPTKRPTTTNSIIIPQDVKRIISPGNSCNYSSLGTNPANSPLNGSYAPRYDSQFVYGYFETHPFLVTNVTATVQTDGYGYGPMYLLNGLSNKNYWYQVGLVYNSPEYNSSRYIAGFALTYEVFSASNYTSIFPPGGKHAGGELFSSPVNSGDTILLSLRFDRFGQVNMSAFDWNTSGSASAVYRGFGAVAFVGADQPTDFFSGLMTEWYHVDQAFCVPEEVIFSNFVYPTNYAWMCIDELDASQSYTPVFASCPFQLFYFPTNSTRLQSFSLQGAIVYGNPYEFVTP